MDNLHWKLQDSEKIMVCVSMPLCLNPTFTKTRNPQKVFIVSLPLASQQNNFLFILSVKTKNTIDILLHNNQIWNLQKLPILSTNSGFFAAKYTCQAFWVYKKGELICWVTIPGWWVRSLPSGYQQDNILVIRQP